MVPEFWLTEGGQSATGALLDYIIENHVASRSLANRAASRRKLFVADFFRYLFSLVSLSELSSFKYMGNVNFFASLCMHIWLSLF